MQLISAIKGVKMTDPIAQARAAGRAEGIREAAAVAWAEKKRRNDQAATADIGIQRTRWIAGAIQSDTIACKIEALRDAPAPTQPAQVSVAEAVQYLTWIIENTSQVRVRDQALHALRALSEETHQ